MNKTHIQFAALTVLGALAGALLWLIGYTFHEAVKHVSPDGKVPLVDAGLFTTFMLSFQQTITTMRSIWESQERSTLTEALRDSTPSATVPKDAADGARKAADAADDAASTLEEKTA